VKLQVDLHQAVSSASQPTLTPMPILLNLPLHCSATQMPPPLNHPNPLADRYSALLQLRQPAEPACSVAQVNQLQPSLSEATPQRLPHLPPLLPLEAFLSVRTTQLRLLLDLRLQLRNPCLEDLGKLPPQLRHRL
jgi:hypothetical protein